MGSETGTEGAGREGRLQLGGVTGFVKNKKDWSSPGISLLHGKTSHLSNPQMLNAF